MKELLLYEFKKFIYNKKNIVIFCIMLIFLGGFIVYNDYQDKKYPDVMYRQMSEANDYASKRVQSLSISDSYSNDENEKEDLQKQKEYWSKLSDTSSILAGEYMMDKNQSVDFVQDEIKWNQIVLEGIHANYNMTPITRDSEKTIKNKIENDQYIIDHQLEILNSPYSCNTLNLFNLLFSDYVGLFLMFLFILLIFDIAPSEFENKSYKILYSSHHARATVFCSKLIFSLFVILAFLMLIAIVFTISGFFFGFGDFVYPYSVYPDIYPFGKAVALLFIIFFIGLLCLTGMIQFLSYWTYSSSVTLVTILSIYMMVIVFQQIFDFRWLYPYIPFCYPFNKDIIQYHGTIICCIIGLITTFLLSVISIKLLDKRDITV